MAITRTNMIDDDGSGTTGTIINNAWKQELYTQIDGILPNWIAIPYSGVTFSATAGAWTVPVANYVRFDYAVVGKIAFFTLMLNSTTLTQAAVKLVLVLPATVPPSIGSADIAAPYFNASVGGTGITQITPGAGLAWIRDIAGTPWAADAGSLFLRAQWFYQIA